MKRLHRFFVVCLGGVCLSLAGCGSAEPEFKTAPPLSDKEPTVEIKELQEGSGDPAKVGDRLKVHYTGWLLDGTKFDSSVDRGTPLPLQLGKGEVIPGWEKGLEGMKAGGKRRLIIPPELAYGKQGHRPTIPPNATLIFEVELVSINAK